MTRSWPHATHAASIIYIICLPYRCLRDCAQPAILLGSTAQLSLSHSGASSFGANNRPIRMVDNDFISSYNNLDIFDIVII